MSNKVHKPEYSSQHAKLAGSLSTLLLIIPILVILSLVYQFASYRWILDILLLWILLGFSNHKNNLVDSCIAAKQNKNQLAKNRLQTSVLRKTEQLSALGIFKAANESLLLRYHHQQFCPMVLFLLAGPMACFAYRLLYEAQQVWSIKRSHFKYFGRLPSTLFNLTVAVVGFVFAISFTFIGKPQMLGSLIFSRLFWRLLLRQAFNLTNTSFLLMVLALVMSEKSGGPVIYNKIKFRRMRLQSPKGYSAEPNALSLNRLIKLINRHLIASILIIAWAQLCFTLL